MNVAKTLRILSHGKITDLSNGFSLPGKAPFSIFVREKGIATMSTNVLMDCKCICDQSASALPVPIGDWTPAEITEISPAAISLDTYDIFWGSGEINK